MPGMNKPYGFPQRLLKRQENTEREHITGLASKALSEITGQKFNKTDEWLEWWKSERK